MCSRLLVSFFFSEVFLSFPQKQTKKIFVPITSILEALFTCRTFLKHQGGEGTNVLVRMAFENPFTSSIYATCFVYGFLIFLPVKIDFRLQAKGIESLCIVS